MTATAALLFACAAAMPVQKAYESFLAGNATDVRTHPHPGFLLAGGGNTPAEVFRWFVRKSDGGDIEVLRASGSDGMNATLRAAGSVNSVESIVFRSADAAREARVLERIGHAEALFIAGGDQWNYVRMWRGTAVNAAIQRLIEKGIPIGGNSAGLAVLGEFAFSAEHDTVTSKDALSDPFDPRVAIVDDFIRIPLLKGTITDTHFAKRDRMGRLLVFMARILQSGKARPVSAIAVDEDCAVLLEPDGAASLEGPGSAYFLRAASAPEVCEQRRPLTFRNIAVYRIQRPGRFNVRTWRGARGVAYSLDVKNGVVTSTQPGGLIY